jgi:hypothetical protein
MLRKTSATLANEITGDFYAVSKLMDHSSPDVTLRYVAQTTAQKKKVADALNTVLAGPERPAEKSDKVESKANGFESENDEKMAAVPPCPPEQIRGHLRLVKSNS